MFAIISDARENVAVLFLVFISRIIWISFQLINTRCTNCSGSPLSVSTEYFPAERARVSAVYLTAFSSFFFTIMQIFNSWKFCKIVIAQQNVKCAQCTQISGCWLHKGIIFQWVNFCSEHCEYIVRSVSRMNYSSYGKIGEGGGVRLSGQKLHEGEKGGIGSVWVVGSTQSAWKWRKSLTQDTEERKASIHYQSILFAHLNSLSHCKPNLACSCPTKIFAEFSKLFISRVWSTRECSLFALL